MKLFKLLDLDYGSRFGVRHKHWVASAVGAAIGLGSTIFGGIQSSKAEKRAREREEKAYNSQQAYWKRKYNEDYSDTAAGRNMLRRAKEFADANWKKSQGAAAVGGASDASVAMAKEQGNKVYSDTMASLASADVQRKDSAAMGIMNSEASYAQAQANQARQQGANIANVASGLSNAAMMAGAAIDSGSQASKTSGVNTPVAETSTGSGGHKFDGSTSIAPTVTAELEKLRDKPISL